MDLLAFAHRRTVQDVVQAISAALVVGIVPVAVLIVIFQERVVSGLTSGGIKG